MTVHRPIRNGKRIAVYHMRATVNGRKVRQTTGCRTEKAAKIRERQIIDQLELAAIGAVDPLIESQRKALDKHVADFEEFFGQGGGARDISRSG